MLKGGLNRPSPLQGEHPGPERFRISDLSSADRLNIDYVGVLRKQRWSPVFKGLLSEVSAMSRTGRCIARYGRLFEHAYNKVSGAKHGEKAEDGGIPDGNGYCIPNKYKHLYSYE